MKVLCSYEVMVTRWCGEHKTSASANVAATTVFAQNTCPSSDAWEVNPGGHTGTVGGASSSVTWYESPEPVSTRDASTAPPVATDTKSAFRSATADVKSRSKSKPGNADTAVKPGARASVGTGGVYVSVAAAVDAVAGGSVFVVANTDTTTSCEMPQKDGAPHTACFFRVHSSFFHAAPVMDAQAYAAVATGYPACHAVKPTGVPSDHSNTCGSVPTFLAPILRAPTQPTARHSHTATTHNTWEALCEACSYGGGVYSATPRTRHWPRPAHR